MSPIVIKDSLLHNYHVLTETNVYVSASSAAIAIAYLPQLCLPVNCK